MCSVSMWRYLDVKIIEKESCIDIWRRIDNKWQIFYETSSENINALSHLPRLGMLQNSTCFSVSFSAAFQVPPFIYKDKMLENHKYISKN